MRLLSPGRDGPGTEVLGELAGRLEARAVPRAPSSAPADRMRAHLLFRAEEAAPDEVAALRRLPETSLRPGPPGGLHELETRTAELAVLAERSAVARCLLAAARNALVPCGPARVMGILNVTPDSFSDGGRYLSPERALEQGFRLIEAGADIIDVGGESTRPGAMPVSTEVELERVVPVVRALARDGRAAIGVDTRKAAVAAAALAEGATLVNDVSAGRDEPELLEVVAARGAGLVLMHMQGSPRTMQERPRYDDVVREVAAFLRERARAAWKAGVETSRIALDPGIGFGKRLEDNLALMRALPELRSLGFPLCLGVSRKSFLGQLSGEELPERRTAETCAAVALADSLGAELHRVHDVGSTRAALAIARALGAPAEGD